MHVLKQFLLLLCLGVICVSVPFLCIANFPYGPLSFGGEKIGDFTFVKKSSIFKSNRFFNGIVFVFGNLRDGNMKMRVTIRRVCDGREVFDKMVIFSKPTGTLNCATEGEANPISLYGKENVEVQKLFKVLNYDKVQQELCDVKSFRLLISDGEIRDGKYEISICQKSALDLYDFAFYAPYFLVY